MTARKMILFALAFLLPCGFLILLTRSVLKSSLGERFLKGYANEKTSISCVSSSFRCRADRWLRRHTNHAATGSPVAQFVDPG